MAILENPLPAIDSGDDIEQLLAAERGKSLLRFSTAGSVDDGKSTLIGRMLYDSRSVYEDTVKSVTKDASIDFALLTDGLRAEREQGITIDVAYRYFSTPRRKFIIADTPGHEQYTRNMATGASTADVAIVLVDARKGILDQTRRHASIAALLGIPLVIAAVNKMDLVAFSQVVFERHRQALQALARQLEIPELIAIPVSALDGDNIVHPSSRTPWYDGPTLLELLETVPLAIESSRTGFRLPVQRVIRPHQDFRGFAGQIAAGAVRPGNEVIVLPSGIRTRVRSISTWDGDLPVAHAPQSVTLTLEDEADISRGDMIAAVDIPPRKASRLEATLVWMQSKPLRRGATYLLKHTTQTVRARVVEIRSRLDVEHLQHDPAEALDLNAIGRVVVETSRPLLADLYRENRSTGSFILIDPADHATAAAGMIGEIFEGETAHHARGALLGLSEPRLAAEMEIRLLAAGALVVRTRVSERERLLALVQAGAVVIAENGQSTPGSITLIEHGAETTLEVAAEATAILAELQSAGVIAETGESVQ